MKGRDTTMNEKAAAKSLKDRFGSLDLRTYTMVFVLIIVLVLFQVVVPGGIYLSSRNLSNLFRQMSITGVITMGTMMLICSGNFDLAVGSVVALTGGIMALLQVNLGWSTPAVILVGLAAGLVLGLWQGIWVAYLNVPSYIVTLGDQLIFRGIYLTLTKGITVTPIHEDFTAIMTSFLPRVLGIVIGVIACIAAAAVFYLKRRSQLKYNLKADKLWAVVLKIAIAWVLIAILVQRMNSYEGIPVAVIILIVVGLIFQFITTKTRFGRRVYAIGGNKESAKLAGINVRKSVAILYVISGALCSLSAVLLTSRLNAAVAAAGNAFEMDCIPACVVGGTSLTGGKGTIAGAIVGALLIACLANGMSLLNFSDYSQRIVKGLVMIVAVWFDVFTQTRK